MDATLLEDSRWDVAVSRYSSNPICGEPGCGKRKGPNQVNGLRCYACKNRAARAAKDARHGVYVENTYGITHETYKALLAYQGNACFICQRATGKTRRLAVDHNHKCSEPHPKSTGCPKCVRGLLCGTCNTWIGRMRDDPQAGERMAIYLRFPPFQQLLRNLN